MAHLEVIGGVNISKSLAWTMVCGIMTGGIWVGFNVAKLSTQVAHLQENVQIVREQLEDARDFRAALETRVRLLENADARADQQIAAILTGLGRIEEKLQDREVNHRHETNQ